MRDIIFGKGFLGKHLQNELREAARFDHHNLELDVAYPILDYYLPCNKAYNLIGYNGGLELNIARKAELLYRNVLMNFKLLWFLQGKAKKVLSTVASCAYDSTVEVYAPAHLMLRKPHRDTEGHGWAKRNIFLLSKMLSESSSTRYICVTPTTVFGPGDKLDPAKSKVVGSLIIKFLNAIRNKQGEIQLLGDGSPKRQLVYVKDCVSLMQLAMEKYEDYCNPLHIASDVEVSIKELADMLRELTGYQGEIKWEGATNGQMRKFLNTYHTKEMFPSFQFTDFYDAMKTTVDWYKNFLL